MRNNRTGGAGDGHGGRSDVARGGGHDRAGWTPADGGGLDEAAAPTAWSVMRDLPLVVAPSDALLDLVALSRLGENLPVPVIAQGEVVGALRGREIETLLLAHQADDAWTCDLCVRDVMLAPVSSVGTDASLEAVAAAVRAHPFKFTFVLNDGRVVGVVTEADLARTRVPASAPLGSC